MSLMKKLTSIFTGGREDEGDIHREYVRCSRCGEKIPVRVSLSNELTPQYEEGEAAYYVRKGVFGRGQTRCFQMIEVELYFNAAHELVSRYVTGGEFITKEEFEAQE